MKKLILSISLTACAVSVFSQGTIVFGNHIIGSVVAPIYGPNPANPAEGLLGNSADGYPPGTTVYPGAPLGTRPGDYLGDHLGTWTAELWGGVSANSLAPVAGADAPILTKGFFVTANTPVVIPGVPEGFPAFLQLRVWDNEGGTITSWAQAIAADLFGLAQSAVFQSLPLGGLAPPPNMVGLTSFNIHWVPEPTTFALAGAGAALLLIFRRRK